MILKDRMLYVIHFLLILISSFETKAQVTIIPQLPETGLFLKNQLWNIVLVNTRPDQVQGSVELSIFDPLTNQQVLAGVSKLITIPVGQSVLLREHLFPIQYNIGSSNHKVDLNPDGFLPIGHFNLCYTINLLAGEVFVRSAEVCEQIIVEPLAPIQQVYPSMGEELSTANPFFSWIPPSPIFALTNASYNLTIYEILNGQTLSDAVQNNIPFLNINGLKHNSFQLGSESFKLDSGKNYVWTVGLENSNLVSSQSDYWPFSYRPFKDFDSLTLTSKNYYRLSMQQTQSYVSFKDEIRFLYNHSLADASVRLKIYRKEKKLSKFSEVFDQQLHVRFGLNPVVMPLVNESWYLKESYFMLVLVDGNGVNWYMNFSNLSK